MRVAKGTPGAKRLWSNYRVIGEVLKSSKTKFTISLGANEGFKCLIIREWYIPRGSDEWRPGKDGISIPLITPCMYRKPSGEVYRGTMEVLAPLMEKIVEAAEAMDNFDLADPEQEYWFLPNKKKGAQ